MAVQITTAVIFFLTPGCRLTLLLVKLVDISRKSIAGHLTLLLKVLTL